MKAEVYNLIYEYLNMVNIFLKEDLATTGGLELTDGKQLKTETSKMRKGWNFGKHIPG